MTTDTLDHVVADIVRHMDNRDTSEPESRGFFGRWRKMLSERREMAELGSAVLKAVDRHMRAQPQRAVVSDTGWQFDRYDPGGITEKVDIQFPTLRALAHECDPVASIIETRIQQVSAFARRPDYRHGLPTTAGFRVRMRKEEDEPDDADVARLNDLEQMIVETGFCAPPPDERPIGWEPGFEGFLKQVVRDTLTMDWVAVRVWASQIDPERFPIVAFAPVDAALVRRVQRPVRAVEDGRRIYGEWEGKRENADAPIEFVKIQNQAGGRVLEEYTRRELFVSRRCPRTDEQARGFGYSELERAAGVAILWLYSKVYNGLRFRKDSLPRGVLTIMGAVDQKQMEMFRLHWKQMMQGLANRWAIPMLQGSPQTGSSVVWTPFDMSSRDMEYHQWMFSLSCWIHSVFSIHPDETGYEATSPYRSTLSEASPETQLRYSQDKGLNALLRWLEQMINSKIIWRLYPDRRYVFEFVGTGDIDIAQHVQTLGIMLQSGLITPREAWSIMDRPLPKPLRNHPAVDLPMPLAQGMAYVDQQHQMEMQERQQEQQMQQGDERHKQEMMMAKLRGYRNADTESMQEGGGEQTVVRKALEQTLDREYWGFI